MCEKLIRVQKYKLIASSRLLGWRFIHTDSIIIMLMALLLLQLQLLLILLLAIYALLNYLWELWIGLFGTSWSWSSSSLISHGIRLSRTNADFIDFNTTIVIPRVWEENWLWKAQARWFLLWLLAVGIAIFCILWLRSMKAIEERRR